MKVVRRIGKSPVELGNTTGVSGSPDILELDDGAFAVIGVDITDQISGLDALSARCAPNERVVRIPRNTLTAAKNDIPEHWMSPLAWALKGSKRLGLDEFGTAFTDAWSRLESRFLNLEGRQAYREHEASASQAAYERGDVETACKLLKQEAEADRPLYEDVARRNIEYARVRLVQEPPTGYLKYELLAYRIRAAIGENIEVVRCDPTVRLPNERHFDFLLFDRHTALIHDYGTGEIGMQTGGWLTRDPSVIAMLEETASALRSRAVPLQRYLTQV